MKGKIMLVLLLINTGFITAVGTRAIYASPQAGSKYTITLSIAIKEGEVVGHAWIVISDGSEKIGAGLYPKNYFDELPNPSAKTCKEIILPGFFGLTVNGTVQDDSLTDRKPNATITWNLTEAQYNFMKEVIRKYMTGEWTAPRYNLFNREGKSCIGFAVYWIDFLFGTGTVEGYTGWPLLGGIPDPAKLFKTLQGKGNNTKMNGGTINLTPTSGEQEVSNIGSVTTVVDTGIENPSKLASLLDLSLTEGNLPSQSQKQYWPVTFTNPVSVNPNYSLVFWDFGDGFSTFGSQTVDYSFDSPGIYNGNLLVLDESGMWKFTFITEVGGVGGYAIPVDKFGLLAPYIGLASTILVATAATAVYVKRVKRRKEKQ